MILLRQLSRKQGLADRKAAWGPAVRRQAARLDRQNIVGAGDPLGARARVPAARGYRNAINQCIKVQAARPG